MCCFGYWAVEDFMTFGPGIARNPTINQYSHVWARTDSGPAQTTEPPGHKPLVVNVVVVGPFEEEEEGIGVASDVVKAEGEDPDTPGYLRVRLGRQRISDRGCVSLGSLRIKSRDRTWWFPNIGLIKQSNTVGTHKMRVQTSSKGKIKMMMIAFITFKSSLVPLFEGLWS